MDLPDKQFLDILEKSDIIINKLLNELTDTKYKLLIKEIENLPIEKKIMNQLIIDRINYLKKNKNKSLSYFSSGELDLKNIFYEEKEKSKKIDKPVSYFSSGELDLINIFYEEEK